LPVEIIKTIQENSKLSLIMADIDFFKKVNDNYGHIAGDNVIEAFAKRLKGFLRNPNGCWKQLMQNYINGKIVEETKSVINSIFLETG
jgi:predicted signal transduction protein with EAL and GGDEF domain